MNARLVTDYWFVWMEGEDWPNMHANEKSARDASQSKARSNPGRSVYVGSLAPVDRLLMPDKIDILKVG